MDPYQIVQLLGPWAERKGPLYERLARAFEQAIRTGELPTETRLPSERWLAQSLSVSRSTIVAAYALLQERGWVTSKRGSGTQVCAFSPKRSLRLRQRQLNPLAHGPTIDSYLSEQMEAIDFSTGAPAWPTGFDAELCTLLPDETVPFLEAYGYVPQGLPQLRQAIAECYTRSGLRTTPEQLLVTTGAQQAITLLATLLLQRGDTVILENPTFFGAIDAFRAAGAHLAAVPIEASGLDLQRLDELLSARVAQCLYLSTFHNPTGNALTDLQRRQLAKMAEEVNLLLIEDLTLANVVFEKEPPPPLAAYAQEGAVITIGSLSKIFWAGLRVGWIRGTVPLIERLARLKAVTDLGSSMISQLIAIQLMPYLEQVKHLRRQELTPRRDLLLELLQSGMPLWSWQRPKGGLFVWVHLPEGDVRDLAQEALHGGVIVLPGTMLSVDGTHTSWLRLPIFLPPDRMQRGLERLFAAWERYRRRMTAMV
jgi:DNA-binding transcriptional MocR family regulator